jgi:hypothetical protein
LGSSVALVTDASAWRIPVVLGDTEVTIVMVAEAPGVRTSRPQVAGWNGSPGTPALQDVLPGKVIAETLTPAGRESLSTTFRAVEGPAFVTTTENVNGCPAVTGLGVAVAVVICRSERAVTGNVAVCELFALLGSGVSAVAVAISWIVWPSLAV